MRTRLLAAIVLVATSLSRAPRAATVVGETDECAAIEPAMRAGATSALLRAYRPSCEGSALAIDFEDACVPTTKVSSLVWERGWGHSWETTLFVTRMDRGDDGAWKVTRLELVAGKGSVGAWGDEATDGVRVRRGVLSGEIVDAVIERAQVLAVAHLEEKPPEMPFGIFLGGMWFSSSDFHDALSFTAGATTHAFELTGYESSLEQPRYLGLDLAVRALDALLPNGALLDAQLDADARAFFVERFLADAPTFDEEFHWWVREDWLPPRRTAETRA